MSIDTLLLFIPACFALNMAFGPNNLLSITIGAHNGLSHALWAAIGRIAAFIIMISIAALGMGVLLMTSQLAFTVVKIGGAIYLVWLGIKMWRASSNVTLTQKSLKTTNLKDLIKQEFLIAIGNPKAILIFTAFFPQFVEPDNYGTSFIILGSIFLLLELVAICLYSYAGTKLSRLVNQPKGLTWVNRISGSMMIAFGLLLAMLKRSPAS